MAIGKHPVMTLKEAGLERDKASAIKASGKDPIEERKRLAATGNSVR